MAIFDEAEKFSTVVLVESTDYKALPEAVRKSFETITPNTIPKVVLSDANGAKVYGSNSYLSMRSGDFRSAWKEAKSAMKDNGKQVAEAAAAAALEESYLQWTSLAGSKLEARLDRINGETVTLINRDGKVFNLKASQLDEASRAQLRVEK